MNVEATGLITADEDSSEHTSTETGAELSTDDVFHLLQSSRRRAALHYLRDANGPVELRDLAEWIAAREHGTTVEALSSQQRQRVYISLYQTHLPKLDECGVVDYRKDRGIVVRRSTASRLDSHLDLADGNDSATSWPRRYAGAVALCVVLLSASTSGLLALSGTAIASLVLVLVGGVTTAHSWTTGWIPTFDR